jgi:hypothetical protein
MKAIEFTIDDSDQIGQNIFWLLIWSADRRVDDYGSFSLVGLDQNRVTGEAPHGR